MKRLLSILASVGLTATAASTVVSCADTNMTNPNMTFGKPEAIPVSDDNSGIEFSNAQASSDGMSITMDASGPLINDLQAEDVTVYWNDADNYEVDPSNQAIVNTPVKVSSVSGSKGDKSISIILASPITKGQAISVNIKNTENDGNMLEVDTSNISQGYYGLEEPNLGGAWNNGVLTLTGLKVTGISELIKNNGTIDISSHISASLVVMDDGYDEETINYGILSAVVDKDGNLTVQIASQRTVENYSSRCHGEFTLSGDNSFIHSGFAKEVPNDGLNEFNKQAPDMLLTPYMFGSQTIVCENFGGHDVQIEDMDGQIVMQSYYLEENNYTGRNGRLDKKLIFLENHQLKDGTTYRLVSIYSSGIKSNPFIYHE